MTEELFDVTDAEDRVIGILPRSVVHTRNLSHRAVHVFVWNSRGELLVQVRSATKDQYPSCYTSSASGHVTSGDDYDDTAVRELREELGLVAALRPLRKFPAGPETCHEHTWLYETTTDASPIPDPGEIAALEWWPRDELANRLTTDLEKFSPCFATLMGWYLTSFPTDGGRESGGAEGSVH
jgi:isopentenyl-diphosphate Delta-isomerase